MTPHWYDLLDVEPDATPDEIRAAWRSASADLDPGDRRFRAFSEAAAVLLDPVRRAEYDAALAEAADEPEPEPAPEPEPVLAEKSPRAPSEAADADEPVKPGEPVEDVKPRALSGRGGPSLAAVVALAVVTLLLVALTVVTAVAWRDAETAPEPVDESAARAAAETAVLDVLAFDYRDLDASAEAARSFMTDDYRKDYDQLFEVISENAPRTQTAVSVELVASGIVRSGDDRVDVLLFVNRPTTNKQLEEPQVFRDQATLRMLLVDGKWLVDDIVTTPAAP